MLKKPNDMKDSTYVGWMVSLTSFLWFIMGIIVGRFWEVMF